MSFFYDKPYIDSSVFIAYIKGEQKKVKETNAAHDCKAIFDSILDAATAGHFKIHISTLVIAEVFKKKMATGIVGVTEEENEELLPYFRNAYIQPVELDRDIAERANELCRKDI